MACLWFLLPLKHNGECVEHFRGLMVRRKWESWPFFGGGGAAIAVALFLFLVKMRASLSCSICGIGK